MHENLSEETIEITTARYTPYSNSGKYDSSNYNF